MSTNRKFNNLDLTNYGQSESFMSQAMFDRFVKDIDVSEVPTKYIEKIVVFDTKGNMIELNKNEIMHPLPINKDGSWESLKRSYKNIKEIKVFVDIPKLEKDINLTVDYLFGSSPTL